MAITPTSLTRLTGLSSGLDTASIVESMLLIEQARIDSQNQTITKMEWKADKLREVNSLIKAFREEYLSVLNSASNMMSRSSYYAFDVTMLTQTNAVSVTAGSSASEGKFTINSISRLAEGAVVKSTDVVTDDISKNATLSELADSFATPLEFDENGEIAFTINGTEFSFTGETTLNEMMNTINASDADVRMTYSSLTKGFTVTSKATGSESSVEIVNTAGNAFELGGAFGFTTLSDTGEDAVLTINGVNVTKSSNRFTIDGITYTLNDTSDTAISFNVAQNVDAVVDKITGFIGAYNELVDKLQGLIGEDIYYDYEPLTDAQKDEMSETEIELWEEKAKSGLLRNDTNISWLLSELRSVFYTVVEGTDTSAYNIGLTTSLYTEGAKITVDEEKLRNALQSNPDMVAALFTNTSKATDSSVKFQESGLVTRISNALLSYTSRATDISLSLLEDQISSAEDRLDVLEDRYATREEALWAKFTAMETALSTMNSQLNWLSSMVLSQNSQQ